MVADVANKDEVLEYAAQLIEEPSLLDIRGILAKRKRDREDADLRYRTIQETKKECAAHIRAFKSRPELEPIGVLKSLSTLDPGHRHDLYLIEAWPLAWKGWLTIECTIVCNSNSTPPETRYAIKITDKGRDALAQKERTMTDDRDSSHSPIVKQT